MLLNLLQWGLIYIFQLKYEKYMYSTSKCSVKSSAVQYISEILKAWYMMILYVMQTNLHHSQIPTS